MKRYVVSIQIEMGNDSGASEAVKKGESWAYEVPMPPSEHPYKPIVLGSRLIPKGDY